MSTDHAFFEETDRVESMGSYLKTLRRIPAPIVLSMATREMDMGHPNACLCGWAVREYIAMTTEIDAEDASTVNADCECQRIFGGSITEWVQIFGGKDEWLEEAFARRLMEACR